jgi:hypothetical protein
MAMSLLSMILTAAPAGALALSQAAPAADTLVTVASRDAFDVIYAVAAGTFVLLLLVLIVALLGALAELRRGLQAMKRAVAQTREAVLADEAMERVRETAGHLEAMAGTLRTETDRAGASIRKVSEKVELASRRMEERIEEFNALMAVVQDEAESAFVDTASTARGVRSSLGELTGLADRPRGRGRTPPLRGPALDAPSGAAPELSPAAGPTDGATPDRATPFPPDPGAPDDPKHLEGPDPEVAP